MVLRRSGRGPAIPSSKSSTESLFDEGVAETGAAIGRNSGGVIALGPGLGRTDGAGTVTAMGRRADAGGGAEDGPRPGLVVGLPSGGDFRARAAAEAPAGCKLGRRAPGLEGSVSSLSVTIAMALTDPSPALLPPILRQRDIRECGGTSAPDVS